MKERGYPFCADMIRAYQRGAKTQTRRLMVPQPPNEAIMKEHDKIPGYWIPYTADGRLMNSCQGNRKNDCGWYAPLLIGDLIVMKETWAICSFSSNWGETNQLQVAYKAGHTDIHPDGMTHDLEWRTVDCETWKKYAQQKYYSWHSSRFMPYFAARYKPPVLAARAQRLQDISFEDARAEGIIVGESYVQGAPNLPKRYESTQAYFDLWDSLHPKPEEQVKANPWVLAYTFQKFLGIPA